MKRFLRIAVWAMASLSAAHAGDGGTIQDAYGRAQNAARCGAAANRMWEQQQQHDFLDLYRYEFAMRYDALADRCYVQTTLALQNGRYFATTLWDAATRRDLAGVIRTAPGLGQGCIGDVCGDGEPMYTRASQFIEDRMRGREK
jgi:hypothetical protein